VYYLIDFHNSRHDVYREFSASVRDAI
jgi:hypothetical protein